MDRDGRKECFINVAGACFIRADVTLSIIGAGDVPRKSPMNILSLYLVLRNNDQVFLTHRLRSNILTEPV